MTIIEKSPIFADANIISQSKAMFKDTKDIYIKGGCFTDPNDSEREYCLSNLFAHRFSIVYGRNGSGKTTLAKSFEAYSHPDDTENSDYHLRFDPPLPDDEARNHIYVFNEDFIENRIRCRGDKGLGAIYMLGQQVDIDDQMNALTEEMKRTENSINETNDESQSLKGQINDCDKRLTAALKVEKGYGGYRRSIRGLQTYRLEPLETIYASRSYQKQYSADASILRGEIEKGISILRNSKNYSVINWLMPVIDAGFSCEQASALLQKVVHAPIVSDSERQLLQTLQDIESSHYVEEMKSVIIKKRPAWCPLCQSPLSGSYIDNLALQLENVFDTTAREYEYELNQFVNGITNLEVHIPEPIKSLFADAVKTCEEATERLNDMRQSVRQQLISKSKNLYVAFNPLNEKEIDLIVSTCIEAFKTLQEAVDTYNNDAKQTKNLAAELEKKNTHLGWLENKDLFEIWNQLLTKYHQAEKELNTQSSHLEEQKAEYKSLLGQKKLVQIALGYINECLSYIYFDKNRLRLQLNADGNYQLLSNGNPVRADRISVGERNVIAMAYFFASLAENRESDKRYSEPLLIVIDDPVSSFDQNNRVGVITLLKKEIFRILHGNKDSRILILSHDLHTISEFLEVGKGLPDKLRVGNDSSEKRQDYPYYLLQDRRIKPVVGKDSNIYRQLLQDIFEFAAASEDSEEGENVIGNQLRRVLEAYSTFNYGRGFDSLFKNDELLTSIPPNKQEYYRNLADRLVLHGDSHPTFYFDPLIPFENQYSVQEKHRLAHDMLLFLYYINRGHLRAYLNEQQFILLGHWAEQDERKYEDDYAKMRVTPTRPYNKSVHQREEKYLSPNLAEDYDEAYIRALIDDCVGEAMTIERDRDTGILHCGDFCQVTEHTSPGRCVLIDRAVPNKHYDTDDNPYPLYAYFTECY